MRHLLLAFLCVAPLGCDPSPSRPAPPLDAVLGTGQARAGKVTRESELIGGPVAYGRVGAVWKLYNARARFLIQDVNASVGLDLYGGNLIDADLVRPGDDGRNGHDLFRETFPIIGLHTLAPRSIEVVSDGTAGGPAHLRVRGTDAVTDILPQIDDISQDLGGDVTVDYILDPDVPYLRIVTTYKASPGQSLVALGLGDFVSFGGSLALFSPEGGYGSKTTSESFLAGVGDVVSYGYVWPGGNVQTPVVDANGTATILQSQALPVDGTMSVTRYLVVGTGDPASVNAPMYALRGTATAPLTGQVTDGGGRPVAGVRVTLFPSEHADTADAFDQARSASDGSYRLDVPPGSYVAVSSGVGRLRGAPVPVTVSSTGTQLPLVAGATGSVVLDVGESIAGQRQPVPAKVSFSATNVESPDPRLGPDPTENERFGLDAIALSPDGHGSFPIKPGTYRALASRGVEYELATVDNLVVGAGAPTPLKVDLQRVVDTTGWLAGDYHQHSAGSIDSGVSVEKRVTEDLAEGVELPAATDHDNVIDFRPHIAALGASRWMGAVPGNEISVNGVGHFNAYPMSVDPADPFAKVGAKYWARQTVRQLAEKVHAEPGPIALHICHPRTRSLAGWLNTVRFDPTTGKAAGDFPIDDFEALEVNGDLGAAADYLPANDAAVHAAATSRPPAGVPTLRDWFALLNLGKRITALGNSDTHGRNGGTGYPRSFVWFGGDDPSVATGAELVQAIKAQKVLVSYGPFVTVSLDGQAKLGQAEVVSLAGVASPQLGVKVQAATWIDVTEFEVYANGRPLSLKRMGPDTFAQRPDGEAGSTLTMPLDPADAKGGVVRLDATIAITPTRDTWYVVVVRGGRAMMPVAGGAPYAYTNPIYADREGDGWTPPGLP